MSTRQATLHEDTNTNPSFGGWRYRVVIVSVLLAAAGYLGFAFWSGWHGVIHAVTKVGVTGIGIALSLSLVNYGLRFIRWQAYLMTMGHPVPWWPSLRIYLAGFALTTTPGKAGEAIRGVLLKSWGVPYPRSLAALLSERLSDLLAVLLLALFGLSLYPAARPLVVAGGALILIAFALLSSQHVLERIEQRIQGTGRLSTLLRHGLEMLQQARRCHTPRLLVIATLLSVLAWSAEAWAFHLTLNWMGIDLPATFAIFVYAASTLAGAASFLPGGLGGAEATMTGLLVWAGADMPDAVAATVIIRLATLWFAVGIGVASITVRVK